MKKALASTYVLSLTIVALLTALGFLFTNPILGWTQVPSEIIPLAKQYLAIMIGGLFFTLIYNMTANILRSFGDSTVPLCFLITAVVLNIVLDYVSIKILGLGVKGVAGATIVSQGIAGLSCVVFCLFRRKIMFVSKKDFQPDAAIYKQTISQGAAMALMLSVVSLSTLILQTGINSLGTTMIAGYMAGRKYLELFMMPGAAFAMTAANFVSQNYGAKQFQRIKTGVNRMLHLNFIWALMTFAIIYIFGRGIITSVTGKTADPEVISSGVTYLRIGAVFFIPLAMLCISRSALQGINHKKTPIFSSIIELTVKVLAVVLFVPKLGFLGICITEPIIWVINGLWLYPAFVRLLKKETKTFEANQ